MNNDAWPYANDLAGLGEELDTRPLPPLVLERRARRSRRPRWPVAVVLFVVAAAITAVLAWPPAVDRGVTVDPDGVGRVAHDGPRTRIDWVSGEVEVDVVPGGGSDVEVVTDEAHVRVTGTHFAVHRDARGTRVRVDRGSVAVACSDGDDTELTPGMSLWCVASAGGALGLVLERLDAGAPDAAVLEAIEWGLSHPVGLERTREALRGHQVLALARSGRDAEAIDAARLLIGTDQREALATAVRLTWPGGCDAARPFLHALVDLGDPDASRLLAACVR